MELPFGNRTKIELKHRPKTQKKYNRYLDEMSHLFDEAVANVSVIKETEVLRKCVGKLNVDRERLEASLASSASLPGR